MSNILEQYNDYYKHKHEYQEKIDKKVLDKKKMIIGQFKR